MFLHAEKYCSCARWIIFLYQTIIRKVVFVITLKEQKIQNRSTPVIKLEDKPRLTSSELKACFDSNSNELKDKLNNVIDILSGEMGAENISTQPIAGYNSQNVQQALEDLADTITKVDPYIGQPVAISQGGTGAKDSPNALYNLGCGVRRNYLDNPDFKINQTKTEYNFPISGGKIIDRWYTEGIGNCEYTENGIITNNQYIRQMWSSGTITAGKWTVSALCSGDTTIQFGKYGHIDTVVKATSDDYSNGFASVTFEVSKEFENIKDYTHYIYIGCFEGLDISKGIINYVKLEKGETQTLSRQLEDGS